MAKVTVNTEENIVTVLADGVIKTVRVTDNTQNRIIKVLTPGPQGVPGTDGAAFTGTLTGSLNVSGALNLIGNATISGGLSVTQGFTGSLYGTASWANNSITTISSSYALTASYVANASSFPFTGSAIISGNLEVTGSTTIKGSVTATSFTGSLSGSVANINGTQYYVPIFTQDSGLSNSTIYQSESFTSIRNATSPEDPNNPDILYVNGDGVDTYNLISAHGNINDYVQINVQNYNNSTAASSDIVATADNGTENTNYVNMGINSTGYDINSSFIGGQLDSYLYSTGNDLLIGNASPNKKVIIFNGGFDTTANARVYIHDQGTVGINTETYNPLYPPALQVQAVNTETPNLISAYGSVDNYLQNSIVNANIGTTASADIVAYNNIDPGNQLAGFIDMGINSTNYVYNGVYPGTAGDGYLFTDSQHLILGAISQSTDTKVTIFAGGISESENAKLILFGNNQHQMTGSLNATEGFSGSLFGTASWALNSLTASYVPASAVSGTIANATSASYSTTASFVTLAQTASYAPLYLPLTGGTINGNVTVNGTASIAFLNVTYESSSIIISTGSNVFGDAANDSQTLYGTVSIPTGSFSVSGSTRITGSLNVTAGITGSLFGTSSWANSSSVAISSSYSLSSSYSVTASYASTATVFPFTGSAIISGSLSVSGSTSINSAAGTTLLSTNADTLIITGSLIVTGSTIITGSLKVSGSITGSLFGTASNAVSASYSVSSSYSLSSSFATTSSYALTASYVLNAVSASFSSTASFVPTAQTASYYLEMDPVFIAKSGSFATTGSNVFVGNQTVTGSLFTSGSNTLIGTTRLSGSLNISGSTFQVGNNNLIGNTTLSGSIIISGALGLNNPTVRIYGDTSHNGYIRFEPVVTNIDNTVSASYIYVSGSTNDLYFSQNGTGYTNTTRLRWIEGNLYTGLLNGGIISANLGTNTYTVSSGSGIIVNLNASYNDNPYPTIQYINWGNLTNTIDALSASYDQQFVAILSNGTIGAQGTPYTDGDYNTKIPIGIVIHQNHSTINAFQTFPSVAYGWKQRSFDFIKAFGPLKISGYELSPSGSSTGSLVLSGGTSWVDGRNYIVNPNNPSYITEATGITTSKIFRYYQSGSEWAYDTNGAAGYTTVDPTQYSNNGTLTLVGTNDWTIQRVFYFPNSATKAFYIYYGNATYANEAAALAAVTTETFTEAPNTAANAIYVGYMLLRYNANFTNAASYKFYSAGLFRSAGSGGGGGGGGATTLTALTDVSITSATDYQPLAYNSTTTKWENRSTISASLKGNADTATTASYATTSSYSVTSSFAITASYIDAGFY